MQPLCKITPAILSIVTSVSEKIGEVNAAHFHRPSPALRKLNRIRTIQSSLEMEGSTLTLEQMTDILGTFTLGYRYMPPSSRWLFRAAFTPFVEIAFGQGNNGSLSGNSDGLVRAVHPSAGHSAGRSF